MARLRYRREGDLREEEGKKFSSQRLRDPARSEGGAASLGFGGESKTRSIEAVRLCRDERIAAGASFREPCKHGYKAAWVVEKYGVRLLPELYEHLNPMPHDAALSRWNQSLADDLLERRLHGDRWALSSRSSAGVIPRVGEARRGTSLGW